VDAQPCQKPDDEIGGYPNFKDNVPLRFLPNNIARDGLDWPTESGAIHLHLVKCELIKPYILSDLKRSSIRFWVNSGIPSGIAIEIIEPFSGKLYWPVPTSLFYGEKTASIGGEVGNSRNTRAGGK
jgi:hypothetical protein